VSPFKSIKKHMLKGMIKINYDRTKYVLFSMFFFIFLYILVFELGFLSFLPEARAQYDECNNDDDCNCDEWCDLGVSPTQCITITPTGCKYFDSCNGITGKSARPGNPDCNYNLDCKNVDQTTCWNVNSLCHVVWTCT